MNDRAEGACRASSREKSAEKFNRKGKKIESIEISPPKFSEIRAENLAADEKILTEAEKRKYYSEAEKSAMKKRKKVRKRRRIEKKKRWKSPGATFEND